MHPCRGNDGRLTNSTLAYRNGLSNTLRHAHTSPHLCSKAIAYIYPDVRTNGHGYTANGHFRPNADTTTNCHAITYAVSSYSLQPHRATEGRSPVASSGLRLQQGRP